MSQRNIGLVVAVIGLIVIVVFVLADVIGVGGTRDTFGYRQIIGVVVGIVLVLVGLFVSRRPGSSAAG